MIKKIFNIAEETTHLKLKEVCSAYEANTYPKMRVADILKIKNSGLTNQEYNYALKAHFDFIVCDNNHIPQFAVEFDGPFHNREPQKSRDQIKNKLCEKFKLPLLRINSNHLPKKYKEYDLISWFVEAWFLQIEFYKAQEDGQIPMDEPFDPMIFYNLPNRKTKFPMWLASEVRKEVRKFSDAGKILGKIISHLVGVDTNNNYHGLAWIKISDEFGVVAKSAMKKQLFPISETELLIEILCFQAFEQLEEVLNDSLNRNKVRNSEINEKVKQFSKKYKMRAFGG